MSQQELIPHLFRTEFRKITAVLCKHFGIDHIEAAEDIASETFLAAFESWTYKGIPEYPVAWLYAVAKNKAKNYLSRQKLFSEKIAGELKQSSSPNEVPEIDLSENNITDSQLQMLFVLCHPSISQEAQIGLSLRILCGFGIDEIANAFLTNKETINKRLYRAKEILRSEKIKFNAEGLSFANVEEVNNRLSVVLTTLYLFFNEGYYSESKDDVLREDLCLEAMRLVYLLIENEQTNRPEVNALMALMCFHSSRFAARKDDNGEMVLYNDQDETLWNNELIDKGICFLHEASKGSRLSKYHLEASIAYWHTVKADTNEKWETILHLYNQLLQMEYSPIAALNHTFVLSKAKGKQAAILEAEKLQLTNNQYYYALLGELYKETDKDKSRINFEKALSLARTEADKKSMEKKLQELN